MISQAMKMAASDVNSEAGSDLSPDLQFGDGRERRQSIDS
jgi:hypothetical protein